MEIFFVKNKYIVNAYNPIELLIENNLHYEISREKFEPEPGFEPRISGFLARRSTT